MLIIYIKKKKKNYDRTQKKKRETNIEKKETHVDNRGFGFWVKISTNFYFNFLLYMVDKVSLYFWRKIKYATYVF